MTEYFTSPPADLAAIEPNLFGTGADPVTVTVGATGTPAVNVAVCMVEQSAGGDYFAVWDGISAGTTYYKGTADPALGTCPTAQPTAAGWSTGGW